jgi:excisionase family DNA binding protein
MRKIKKIMSELLTRKEAGEALKISPKTIDRLIKDGRIKSFKLGRKVRIYSETLTEDNINAIKPNFTNQKTK